MEAVLDVLRAVLISVQSPGVGLIFREQQRRLALAPEKPLAVILMLQLNKTEVLRCGSFTHPWPTSIEPPRPCIPEPQRGQQGQLSTFRPPVRDMDPHEEFFWCRLGILHHHIEIAILIKHTRINELVFSVASSTTAILLSQLGIRKLALWILIQILHV